MRLIADRAEILAACRALFEPGQVVEARCLDATTRSYSRPHTVAGWFDDWERLASATAGIRARGVYVTLNPLPRALLDRAANRLVDVRAGQPLTADTDVLRRRWLPVDLDPVRPAGVSATAEEHAAAQARGQAVAEWLAKAGWPAPLVADSGNGSHLLYRVDLPADAGPLLAAALTALARRFDDPAVKVDRKVFNAARIWKLYGTVAAKGEDTPDRPHRRSRLLPAPAASAAAGAGAGVVTEAQLAELARRTGVNLPAHARALGGARGAFDLDAVNGAATRRPFDLDTVGGAATRRPFDLDAWIAAHRLEVGAPRPWQNGRRWVFRVCPWNPAHTDRSAYIVQFPDGAVAAGCHHDTCAGRDWPALRRLVESAPRPDRAADLAEQPDRAAAHPERSRAAVPAAPPKDAPAAIEAGEYLIEGGRIWKRTFEEGKRGAAVEVARRVIADFAVTIVEEARAEDGSVWFTLAGETALGKPLRLTLPVTAFTAEKELLAALTAAAGARCGVRANMAGWLRPAIQALSGAVASVRAFNRTGWTEVDGAPRFLIPGREVDGAVVRLRKLPFETPRVTGRAAEHAAALAGLRSLLLSLEPERTTVIATLVFQAPFARLAGWAGDRYGIFIAGRTGSLKTSFAQTLMRIYGAGFGEDQYLLKFGEGATRNALLSYAEQAHDLPLFVDNYKPNTGDGAKGLVNLLHNLIEGAGRERLSRDAELMAARPIGCWPLLTGEDAPAGDAAAVARLLVVPVRWEAAGNNDALAAAQAAGARFPLLGAAWLDWLESADGPAAAARARAGFESARARWVARLQPGRGGPGAANPLRVATNLATNELTWQALAAHPLLGAVAREFAAAHAAGLELLAGEMARQTAENVEAVRFVDVLQQLLAGGAYRLAQREDPCPSGARGDVVGWHAPDGGAYLLPDMARRAVEQALGGDGLNRVSNEALYGQLEALGLLGEHQPGRRTKVLRDGAGRLVRVVHVTGAALGTEDEANG